MKSVKDKLIITAAVGFTAASTMVNPVLAEEVKNPAFVKEDASQTKILSRMLRAIWMKKRQM